MIFQKRLPFLIVFILALFFDSATANSQSNVPNWQNVTKTDGRFTANIRGSAAFLNNEGKGFIKEIDIEIEWWTLIGQPVEIFGFRWERGDTFRLGGVEDTLYRSSLEKYPDLLKRYDDLQPSNITLSFRVGLNAEGNDVSAIEANAKISKIGETFYIQDSRRSSGKVKTNQVLIAGSGKMMRDFSPGSPDSWRNFIKFDAKTFSAQPRDPETATANTYKLAEQILFSALRLESVDLPEVSARAILEEFKRREKIEKENKNENKNENENVNGDGLSDKPYLEESSSGIGGSSSTTKNIDSESFSFNANSAPPESEDNLFPTEGAKKDRSKREVQSQKEGKTKNAIKASNKVGEAWELVYYRDDGPQTYGVISKVDGRELFPYVDKRIVRYDNGRAWSLVKTDTKEYLCNTNSIFGNTYAELNRYKYGEINRKGNWINQPRVFTNDSLVNCPKNWKGGWGKGYEFMNSEGLALGRTMISTDEFNSIINPNYK